MHSAFLTLVLSLVSVPGGSISQGDPVATQAGEAETGDQVVTEHVLTLSGESIPYRARAGTLLMTREGEQDVASTFFVDTASTARSKGGCRIFPGAPPEARRPSSPERKNKRKCPDRKTDQQTASQILALATE